MNKKIIILLTLILFLPINTLAYSNKIYVGGETIGIEAKSDGIYVIGFYEVDNENIAEKAGFRVGDLITEIDNQKINKITDINKIIKEEKEYNFKLIRNNKEENIKLNLQEENNYIKTGLLVKDKIFGIGTLSYIDPETKVYASLGHEILETNMNEKFIIKTGKIYKAETVSIKKSINNDPGEKNANISKEEIGDIEKNEINGIYGIYDDQIDTNNLLEIANINEIRKGKAYIKTSIDKENKLYEIEIININESEEVKNILFEITDKELLDKTGGIVQGMSGSPIIQNNKIIGVVNYVIVDDVKKGYGVFITKMLEEGDKLLNN